jgi:hypothetical protein
LFWLFCSRVFGSGCFARLKKRNEKKEKKKRKKEKHKKKENKIKKWYQYPALVNSTCTREMRFWRKRVKRKEK